MVGCKWNFNDGTKTTKAWKKRMTTKCEISQGLGINGLMSSAEMI
jgi:hypothetical protein